MSSDSLVPVSSGLVPSRAPLIEAFFAGRNERTLAAYRSDLDAFRLFVGQSTLGDAARLLLGAGHGEANAIAHAFRAHMVERRLAPASINRRLAALRSLVRLANTLGMVPWQLMVENTRGEAYRDTRGPGRDGFRTLHDRGQLRTDAKGLRDVAILRLLHDLGLRRGEVVGLDLEHVDLEGDRLFIKGKGRTQLEPVTMPEPTKAAVVSWMKARGEEAGALFINYDRAGKGSGRLTGAAVYHIVATLGQSAGMTVRPHGLRHSAITAALDLTNGDVRAVQRFSRHKDVRVLNRYDDNRRDIAGEVAKMVATIA